MNIEVQKDDLVRAALCDSEKMRGHVYASIETNKRHWMADCIGEDVILARSMQYAVSVDLDPMDRAITISIRVTGPERTDGRGGPARVDRKISVFPISRSKNPRAMLIDHFEGLRGMVRAATLGVVGVPECYLLCLDEIYVDGIGVAIDLLKGDGEVKKQMGLILMENEDGNVSVHVYAESGRAGDAFKEMVGKPGDPKIRATLVSLDYEGGEATVEAKDLPNPKMDDSDAWLLGTGPIKFEEDSDGKAE
jgi:hypothetical protein